MLYYIILYYIILYYCKLFFKIVHIPIFFKLVLNFLANENTFTENI